MAMIDNVLHTLFIIFKQDGSLLICTLHYHVNSNCINVMSNYFVPYKLNEVCVFIRVCTAWLQADRQHVTPRTVMYTLCTLDIPHYRRIQWARHYSGARDEGGKMASSTF